VISGRYSSLGLNDAATAADRRAAKQWLKFFGLDSLAMRKPREVSYGQMRRALLARAMINRPKLLLLDEPMTGLDTEARAELKALFFKLAKTGVQFVMAVHDLADVPSFVKHSLHIHKNKSIEVRHNRF